MFIITKSHIRLLLLTIICLSVANVSFSQRIDPNSRMSNHYDRSNLAVYDHYSNAYKEQNLNNIAHSKILYNYYLSLLFRNITNTSDDVKERLKDISNRLKELSPDGFESNYIQFLQNKGTENGLSFLKRAYDSEPSEIEIWDEMLGYYEINGDEPKARALAKQIQKSDKYHSDVYEYQRNVIASCEGNSILFVHGELDTYPLLVTLLNESNDNDIVVINQGLLAYGSYREKVTKKIGASVKIGKTISAKFMNDLENDHLNFRMYLALTMNKNTLRSLKKNLYLTGILFEYSSQSIDNITVCERNFKNNLKLNHLLNKSLKPIEVRDLHRNYIPLLDLLENHSSNFSQEEKNSISTLIDIINNSLPNH